MIGRESAEHCRPVDAEGVVVPVGRDQVCECRNPGEHHLWRPAQQRELPSPGGIGALSTAYSRDSASDFVPIQRNPAESQ